MYQALPCLKVTSTQVEVGRTMHRAKVKTSDTFTGGGGNIYKPTEEERQTAKSENEKLRSASFSRDRSGLKGLADKAKEALKGSSTSNKE